MLQTQNNPWLGLASYMEKDADLFFGRENETELICELIKQNYSTIIYGKSGMGKTSLINAGLIPRLSRDSFFPVSIKLEHNVSRNYSSQIIEIVTSKLKEHGCDVETNFNFDVKNLSDKCKLWSFFHTNVFWSKDNHRIIPVVFIDQFEEIFTLCENKSNISSFFSLLNDLFQPLPPDELLQLIEKNNKRIDFQEVTNFRLVISLREDFLARLEDYAHNIPILRKNRIGISPMNGLQALDVILKPASGIINREAAFKVLEKVSKATYIEDDEEFLNNLVIETCLLSLFCTQLYKKTLELKSDSISSDMIERFGDNIINDYYKECMKNISKESVRFLEDKLLTNSGYRNSLAYEDVVPKYVSKKEISHLEKCRLVRIEVLNKTERIEFTHDVLCAVAIEHKTSRKKNDEMRQKMISVFIHIMEYMLYLKFFTSLFFKTEDPFRCIKGNELAMFASFFILSFSMLMRFAIFNTNRNSILFSTLTFLLGNGAGILGGYTLDKMGVPENSWPYWMLLYIVYIWIIYFFTFFTKLPGNSFVGLLKSSLSFKNYSPVSFKSFGLFIGGCYIFMTLVSGVYMRTLLTVAVIIGLVPVMFFIISLWKKDIFKKRFVWICGFVMIALLCVLYFSQFLHIRYLTYLSIILLLVFTYLIVTNIFNLKSVQRKCLISTSVWLVGFVILPTIIIGYNFWSLGDKVFVKDGLIVYLDNKLMNRYIVLEDTEGRQGVFNRLTQVLIPARFRYISSQAIYADTNVGNIVMNDVEFSVNKTDFVFISDYLSYSNKFSRQLLSYFERVIDVNVNDSIKIKTTVKSNDLQRKESDLDELCDNSLIKASLYPDIYLKMAKYYHEKDSFNMETAMLAKSLYYAIACDSTTRFLAKGNWQSNLTETVSSLLSAIVYVQTGHQYSYYTSEYDSYFLANIPYQQFVKSFIHDLEPEVFLSKIIDCGKYDEIITNVLSKQRFKSVSLHNELYNEYIRKAFEREGNLVSQSFVLMFMGKYEEAKQLSLQAIDSDSTSYFLNDNLIATTNLLTSKFFLGEYDDVYDMLDLYNDSIIYNGTYKFYRDWILQDFNDFEITNIIDDVPYKVYKKLRSYIDPNNDRNYYSIAINKQYNAYWAGTNQYSELFGLIYNPFGLGRDGKVFLLDETGKQITPVFDDVYIANKVLDFNFNSNSNLEYSYWSHDPIIIYSINGKRGYYNVSTKKYITGAIFDRAWMFSEGLAAVAKYNKEEGVLKVGFINEIGEVVIPFKYDYIQGKDYVFHGGKVLVDINKKGEIITDSITI